MLRPIRRLLTGALVVAVATGAGLVVAPSPAAAAAVRATVKVSGTLKVRTGPSTSARAVGSLRNGAKVAVDCAVVGQRISGSVRTTRQWNRLTNGRYVSHGYLRTATKIAACKPRPAPAAAPSGPAAPEPVVGTIDSGDGAVNLRTGPSTAAAVQGAAAHGSRLSLTCAVSGEYISGTVRATNQWDRLADGRYVSHAYVRSAVLPVCPGGVAPAPTMTNEQFIAAAVPGAQQGWREFGVPPSVTIAQAILESGWGRSGLAASDRNYFGIKCFNGNPGTIAAGCRTYRTTECDKAGKCFGTEATFRSYRTVADSFRDHGHFLRVNSRYQPAFQHTRDADRFLAAIWKAGYATDPHYVAKVTNLMKSYDLYRYDTWR